MREQVFRQGRRCRDIVRRLPAVTPDLGEPAVFAPELPPHHTVLGFPSPGRVERVDRWLYAVRRQPDGGNVTTMDDGMYEVFRAARRAARRGEFGTALEIYDRLVRSPGRCGRRARAGRRDAGRVCGCTSTSSPRCCATPASRSRSADGTAPGGALLVALRSSFRAAEFLGRGRRVASCRI